MKALFTSVQIDNALNVVYDRLLTDSEFFQEDHTVTATGHQPKMANILTSFLPSK